MSTRPGNDSSSSSNIINPSSDRNRIDPSSSSSNSGGSYNSRDDARHIPANMLPTFGPSNSNAAVPDNVDISNQQVVVSQLSDSVYGNTATEDQLITIITQLNGLITENQTQINNINRQLRVREQGLAATRVDVPLLSRNVAAYTAMTMYYGVLLTEIQRQMQERNLRALAEPELIALSKSRQTILQIIQTFETLRTQQIVQLTPDEWTELQTVINNFIQRKKDKKEILLRLKSLWETFRDTSIQRGSAVGYAIYNAAGTYGLPVGAAFAGTIALQTASYMRNTSGELVLYVPQESTVNSLIQYIPSPVLAFTNFLSRSNSYVVRFTAGGATLVINNPVLSISVVSLLAIYATLPVYAQQRIRGAIVFLLRLIFIQTPTVGLQGVLIIFNYIVEPLWRLLTRLVGAPGQIVMTLFNLFPSPSNMNWDTMTQWIASMWSYITNTPIVRLAGNMITGSSGSSRSSSSISSSSIAAQRAATSTAQLATTSSAQLAASPSSSSSNAASSSNAQLTTGIPAAASNSDQGFTVTVNNGQEIPMPNLTFTASSQENTAADTAIGLLNENTNLDEATANITTNLTTPDQASPEQLLTDTTTTLVEAVVNAGDENTVNRIESVSRNPTPNNSQVAGEEPVLPKDAGIIAAAALNTLENLVEDVEGANKRQKKDDENIGDENIGDENIGGRRKSRRRRTRSTKKRSIRRRRGTKKRQRRYTKRRRGLRRR
jgi:hypothetical protein